MLAIALFVHFVKENYSLIMDTELNSLRRLPPAQRFQTMVYLATMWTTVFCAAFGIWFLYRELLVAHLLVVLGLILTNLTFILAESIEDTAEKVRS